MLGERAGIRGTACHFNVGVATIDREKNSNITVLHGFVGTGPITLAPETFDSGLCRINGNLEKMVIF